MTQREYEKYVFIKFKGHSRLLLGNVNDAINIQYRHYTKISNSTT